MTDLEYVFKLKVPGSNAKSAMYQARCETTTVGLTWTLTGDLARAVHELTKHVRIATERRFLTDRLEGRVSSPDILDAGAPHLSEES